VVLSSQRVESKDVLANVANQKEQAKEAAADPLVQNGQRLMPSVTRVFSKANSFYVFLQTYQPLSSTAQPVIAYVSFYQGQSKVFETQPQEVTPVGNTKLDVASLNFTVDLNQLPVGRYDCQVTVIDPTGQKSSYWQAPIMLVQ
jgi:hypothetical protein